MNALNMEKIELGPGIIYEVSGSKGIPFVGCHCGNNSADSQY